MINPGILQGIANPQQTDIAGLYQRGVESRVAREDKEFKREAFIREEKRAIDKRAEDSEAFQVSQKRALLSFDNEQKESNLAEAKIINDFINQAKIDAENSPQLLNDPNARRQYLLEKLEFIKDKDLRKFITTVPPEKYAVAQKNAQFAIQTYSDSKTQEVFSDFIKIPGTELFGQISSKTGKYTNVRNGIDGQSAQGNSEFERGIQRGVAEGYISKSQATDLRKKRTAVLAGTEVRKGAELRLSETQTDRYNKETKSLREEYGKGAKHFKDMGESIDAAFAAMDSGDTRLSEVLLNQVMSQVQDSNVRAYQMYHQFDQEFGNLAQRLIGMGSRFLAGTRTDRETEEIKKVLGSFKDNYVDPAQGNLRNRYREFALQQGKQPFIVVPPKDVFDIKNSTLLDRKEKIEMIRRFFPDWKP